MLPLFGQIVQIESQGNKSIYYVADDDFENEYENYEYWYANDQNTEKPIKKNDHYMNAVEYCIWGIKEYLDIMI